MIPSGYGGRAGRRGGRSARGSAGLSFGRHIRQTLRRLAAHRSGSALVEFALGLPLILVAGGSGIEYANLAVVNLSVNQIAINLSDNAARVGNDTGLATLQLRETDINDVLQGVRLQGAGIGLTTYGRITVSSLENIRQSYDAAAVQRIHWQRCIGQKSGTGYDSSYGTTTTTAGTDATVTNAGTTAATGMGPTGAKVNAPSGSGVIFVEVNYLYQPLFGSLFITPPRISAIASLIVRDNRDFAQVYNPSPVATRATCNLYPA